MAKTDDQVAEEVTNETEPETAPETAAPAVNVPVLEKAVADANTALIDAQEAFKAAGRAGDIGPMMEAARKLDAAQRTVEKAQNALTAATWQEKAEERLAFGQAIQEAVRTFAGTLDVKAAIGLGYRGFSVVFNTEDGSVQVNVNADQPKVAGTRKPSTPSEGGTRTQQRGLWVYNGAQYTSKELLQNFGGAEGQIAIEKAAPDGPNGWKTNGLKFSPGFDGPVKKLAAQLGATKE